MFNDIRLNIILYFSMTEYYLNIRLDGVNNIIVECGLRFYPIGHLGIRKLILIARVLEIKGLISLYIKLGLGQAQVILC